jgi:hypothetical protein
VTINLAILTQEEIDTITEIVDAARVREQQRRASGSSEAKLDTILQSLTGMQERIAQLEGRHGQTMGPVHGPPHLHSTPHARYFTATGQPNVSHAVGHAFQQPLPQLSQAPLAMASTSFASQVWDRGRTEGLVVADLVLCIYRTSHLLT